jgi:hypothetical protein
VGWNGRGWFRGHLGGSFGRSLGSGFGSSPRSAERAGHRLIGLAGIALVTLHPQRVASNQLQRQVVPIADCTED